MSISDNRPELIRLPPASWTSLSRRIAGQSVVFATATAAASLLSAVVKAVLARHLSASAFGSYSFAISFLLFVAIFFELGLFLPAARLAARAQGRERREIVGAAFLMYALLGLAFCALVFASSFVVDSWFHVHSGDALLVVAPLAFVYPFGHLALWLAQGTGRLHIYSGSVVLGQALVAISIVLLVLVDDRPSLTAPLVLQSLSLSGGWLLFVFLFRPLFRRARTHVSKIVRDARAFGFQVYVGRVLSIGTYNMDVLMLAAWREPKEVGLYALAGALAAAGGLPVMGLANALFPRMVSARRLEGEWLAISWGFGFVLALLVWLAAEPFFRVAFSAEYVTAAHFVFPLALAQVVRGVTGLYNMFLAAQGRGKDLRNAGVVLTGSNLILNFLLIPKYGATGAAWASLLALVANYVAHVHFYRRSLGRPAVGSEVEWESQPVP